MSPSQAGELCKIAVRGDPFAVVLDGECGKVGIGDEIAANRGKATEVREQGQCEFEGAIIWQSGD